LYGTLTTGNFHQNVLDVVQLDPSSGMFTALVEEIQSVGKFDIGAQASCFDNDNQYYYFVSTVFPSIISGVDVANNALLPPIFTNFSSVFSIAWDGANSQLLVVGKFTDSLDTFETMALYTIPQNGAVDAQLLLNFTALGYDNIYNTAFDPTKGTFYFSYNPNTGTYNIGAFPIDDPAGLEESKTNCTLENIDLQTGDFMFYDPILRRLVGLATFDTVISSPLYYFEIYNEEICILQELGPQGIMVGATYDPTSGILYADFYPDGNNDQPDGFIAVDTTTQMYSFFSLVGQNSTLRLLSGVQVSFDL